MKIRLHTENQLPRLPGSALKVPGGGCVGWVASYPLSSQAPTHVEVELGCDNTYIQVVWKLQFSNRPKIIDRLGVFAYLLLYICFLIPHWTCLLI